jgi:Uma2 family endonuclease
VEVLSRSTAARDRGRKMQMLARFGVPEYWIVGPVANTTEIYTLGSSGYRLAGTYTERDEVTSPTLPGLSFAAWQIFQE